MIFREIFLNNELIGLIGWNKGVVSVRLKDEKYEEQISMLMGTNTIKTAVIVADISISGFKMVSQKEEDWLGLLDVKQNNGITLGPVSEITKKKFKELPI